MAVEWSKFRQFVLAQSPENQEMLRLALGLAWSEGYDWCYEGGGDMNPFVEGNPFLDTRDA